MLLHVVPTEKSVRGPLRDSRREHLRTGGRSRRWAVRLAATGPFCDPNWYVRPAARLRGRRPHLVLFPRRPRSGEPRPAPASRDPGPAAAPAAPLRPRPRLLGRPRKALARLARHARHRAARDRHSLAPPRLPPLLALAVTSDRTSLDQSRSANTHPSHRHREPRLGRAANPWRVAQARHRRRPVHGCQVHAAAEQASLADLAHLSAQPYELRCRHRLLYDPDGPLSRPLRLRRPRPRAAPHPPPRRHRAPDCRVDPHPTARRSAGTAALRPSRPWLRLRGTRRLPPSPRLRGGGRQRASVALAESLRRKGDRLHPARFARPCDRPRRGPRPQTAAPVRRVLQLDEDASRAREGLAGRPRSQRPGRASVRSGTGSRGAVEPVVRPSIRRSPSSSAPWPSPIPSGARRASMASSSSSG